MDTGGMELRLSQYINYKTGGKKSEFADLLGWSKQYLNNILKGSTGLGIAPLASLLKTFPDLSARWLVLGEGAMLDSAASCIKQRMYALLALDRYIAVMTPEELRAVESGKLDWSNDDISRWELLTAERQAAIDKKFSDAYARQ